MRTRTTRATEIPAARKDTNTFTKATGRVRELARVRSFQVHLCVMLHACSGSGDRVFGGHEFSNAFYFGIYSYVVMLCMVVFARGTTEKITERELNIE